MDHRKLRVQRCATGVGSVDERLPEHVDPVDVTPNLVVEAGLVETDDVEVRAAE
jgi:hypothetical protein